MKELTIQLSIILKWISQIVRKKSTVLIYENHLGLFVEVGSYLTFMLMNGEQNLTNDPPHTQ